MASRLDTGLAKWFDEGLACAQFKVLSGRHIILNEFPRLMKVARLRASARVVETDFLEFLLTINPQIETVQDGSSEGIRRKLAIELGPLPALRKVLVPVLPAQRHEHWFVYTPPLSVMRESWRKVKSATEH